jgi:hypothetical protein
MQYREIVAVTGLGGLFQLMATKSDGAIVRSLADNATKFIPSRLHSVTPLESIEIYTTGQNVRLHEVLQKMKESEQARPDMKKAKDADIRGYFKVVYPDMDEDRVYSSDMKKMLKWFEILDGANLMDFSAYNQPQESVESTDAPEVEAAEEKPVASKKAATENADGEEKPAKKAAKKNAEVAEGEEAPVKKAKAKKNEE